MALWSGFRTSGDGAAFKLLFLLAVMYGVMSFIVYATVHMKFIEPLGIDAPLDRFSEARAVQHVRVLAHDIGGRQEGSPGLREAAQYIKGQLESFKKDAGSNLKVEIEEETVDGSFSMLFLGYSISFGYRNHTNIVMRVASSSSQDIEPSVLINGHFDSPLGSPGAGDCGSCVASMLELARLVVDSGWIPPKPIIFLFNGAEELFMLGAHGFMKTNKWRDSIGAAINVEASGNGGLDLVCQSGPGSWPSRIYAESAIYPMAHSAAQDVFPVIPGDTDYRIFSEDYGKIPGLDIIFLLGGYFYHTSYDTVDRLLPGSIQARGENLFSMIKAFTNSSMLKDVHERESLESIDNRHTDDRAVFFDYLLWFMVFYPKNVAVILHSLPIAVFLIMPLVLYLLNHDSRGYFGIVFDYMKGTLLHAVGIILAVLLPVVFSILRLLFVGYSMNWFAHPFLAFFMFVPCSIIGLLIPRFIWSSFQLSQLSSSSKMSQEVLLDEARFWGAFMFYSILTLAYIVAGLSGGFLTFLISCSMLLAWTAFRSGIKSSNPQSLKLAVLYVVPLVPCLIYSLYFGGFLVQFLIEKMGMMGSVPPPYGFFIPDIIIAAITGVAMGWSVGPLIPICGRWLAKSSILQFLLQLTVLALAVSSQFFPYSKDAPKRVVFQHTFVTDGEDQIVRSNYDFAVVDSNSLLFLFKYAPEVAKTLDIASDFSYEDSNLSNSKDWMVLFPVPFLFSRTLKFPAKSEDILLHYEDLPYISMYKHQFYGEESRKVYLQLSLGSLKEVWVAVLNITGPLSSWSFADQTLPAPESIDGGPPSYICRLSGLGDDWNFWLEANTSELLRVEVGVLDQYMVDSARNLKSLFPDWVDVTSYSSFMSTYFF